MADTSWVSLLDQAACSNSSMCRERHTEQAAALALKQCSVCHTLCSQGQRLPSHTHTNFHTALHTCHRAVWHLVVLIVAAAAATTLSLNAAPALPSSVRTVSCTRAPQKSSSLWAW